MRTVQPDVLGDRAVAGDRGHGERKHRTAYVWLKAASNTALVLVAFALVYLVLDSMARTGAAAIH